MEGREEYMEYMRIVPGIGYYLKNKNISNIFKHKCASLAVTGGRRIYLFSNSLEEMGSLSGHKGEISCLSIIRNRILASGSEDMNIKMWEIEEKCLICTLSGDREAVTALCAVGEDLVSGSHSLIMWSKLPGSNIYSQTRVITGPTSNIEGIIQINKAEIVSGGTDGDLRIWILDQGICTTNIPTPDIDDDGYRLSQIKQYAGNIALNYYWGKVSLWGSANHWAKPLNQFDVNAGHSIEFLSGDILFRGDSNGQLQFIHYSHQILSFLPPSITKLHSNSIEAILRIANNIVLTASADGSLKVLDPISRKCYLKFKKDDKSMRALAYFY